MAIMKKTFTVADTPVDAEWKKESASTHRKYPATKSQMTLFDRALFMMTSWLPGAGITHAMGRTTQAEQTDRLATHHDRPRRRNLQENGIMIRRYSRGVFQQDRPEAVIAWVAHRSSLLLNRRRAMLSVRSTGGTGQ